MEEKELWFKQSHGGDRAQKLKLLLWRIVYHLFFTHSLTIFSNWRVFLLRLFGAKIGKGCYIAPRVVIYMPWNVEIGNVTSIDDYCNLRSTGKIIIGDYVSLGIGVHILPGGHDIRSRGFENNATFVKIENGCFLGAQSFVGRGVTIGQFSVLGARAVTYKDIPENSIAVGFPAKVISERIPQKEYIKYRFNYQQ